MFQNNYSHEHEHTHTNMCVQPHTHTLTHSVTYTHSQTHTHTLSLSHTHKNTHTHTHTQAHTYSISLLPYHRDYVISSVPKIYSIYPVSILSRFVHPYFSGFKISNLKTVTLKFPISCNAFTSVYTANPDYPA